MIFSSFIYLLFLTVSVTLYYILPVRIRWVFLLIASIVYYLSFIPLFLLLISGIVLVNYFLTRQIAKLNETKSGYFMAVIVAINIAILAFFKYFNLFFPDNQIHLYNVRLFYQIDPINRMILPLGLSYIIFTILSYQIEVRRKNIEVERHFGYFSLFIMFFPKIAQGPIERPQNLIPQLKIQHIFTSESISTGLKLILWGYFKKLVVADRLAIYVNAVFDNSSQHNGPTLVVATVFFAFQVYADFSGYTDIALGSARLFGINLTNNFRRPYLATSIKDFWDRWHITFSTWLRDYIFLPIAYFLAGRMRKEKYLGISNDKWNYLISILLTFTICGIWHGVGWTYIIWGILFGIYLTWANWTRTLNKSISKRLKVRKKSRVYLFYKVLTTFLLVSFAWIFFRASSINDAFLIIKRILTTTGSVFYENPSNLILAVVGVLILIMAEFKQEYYDKKWSVIQNKYLSVRVAGIIFIVLTILLIGVFDGGQFIYFQF